MRKVSIFLALLVLCGGFVFAGGKKESPSQEPSESATSESPTPEWAKTLNGVVMEYPNAQYIAQRGRGADLISAQNDGVAQISRWISSKIETSVSSRESITNITEKPMRF